MPRLLILGGTSEAAALAAALAREPAIDALVSLAGRTSAPKPPPLPHRVGGFGGAAGLAAFLRDHRIAGVIDATHPFAARLKANAAAACADAGVSLLAFRRPAWAPGPGDRWIEVDDAPAAAAALGERPRRVFLTAGRLELPAFLAAPRHRYWIRAIDPPEALPPLATLILARGPFDRAAERDLMREAAIEILVTKNSGGEATRAKLDAARDLALPVIMIRRPPAPDTQATASLDEALAFARRHGSTRLGE